MANEAELMDVEEDTQKDRYLTFSLGKEAYGIEIKYVTEIIGIQSVTEIPEMPEYVKGIINLRGKVVPAIDVRLRFKKAPREYNDRTCMIVVDNGGISIGLIVDSVSEVLSISRNEIVSPPEINRSVNNYIKGIGKVGNDVKLILDCNKLIAIEAVENLLNL